MTHEVVCGGGCKQVLRVQQLLGLLPHAASFSGSEVP